MMQRWGHKQVSSAREVYILLSDPPSEPRDQGLLQNLLSIEPPIWGCAGARGAACALAACGFRVWSWDDHGVVFSDVESIPPRNLRYWPWYRVALPLPPFQNVTSLFIADAPVVLPETHIPANSLSRHAFSLIFSLSRIVLPFV
jgi:hypothetical protein